MTKPIKLLTDEQMKQFITNGFLILKTDFSSEFHDRLLGSLSEVYSKEGNPGNNLLPRIREVQTVFDHPVIDGALTSVLGSGYMLHAHRHGHYNNSPKPGGWHKDSYWGYSRLRNHRPWWAMIMYFPQDTPLELGPTGVFPGTHLYETRIFSADDSADEATAAGKAGTFALIHYDIWHRSTANQLGTERFMLKFEFMRTQAPTQPSWDNCEAEWSTPAVLNPALYSHEVIWQDIWNWLSGRSQQLTDGSAMRQIAATSQASSEKDIGAWEAVVEVGAERASAEDTGADTEQVGAEDSDAKRASANQTGARDKDAEQIGAMDAAVGEVIKQLQSEDVRVRTEAADRLAIWEWSEESSHHYDDAVAALALTLESAFEPAALNAAYGLARLGGAGLAALHRTLLHGSRPASRTAAYGLTAAGAPAVEGLLAALDSGQEDAATHAAFALGELREAAAAAVPALARLRAHEAVRVRSEAVDALGRIGVPAEACTAALASSLQDESVQVRFMAGLALTMLGANAEAAVPALITALDDDNRYVRAHAAEALYYIGTDRAKDDLIRFLRTSRWCPSTTSASTFYP